VYPLERTRRRNKIEKKSDDYMHTIDYIQTLRDEVKLLRGKIELLKRENERLRKE